MKMDSDMMERQDATNLIGDKTIYSGSAAYYGLIRMVTKLMVDKRDLKKQVTKLKREARERNT